MARPDGGMFGIKIILPAHLGHSFFTDDFDGGGEADGRRTLMNFSDEGKGPSIAANIPIGHRSLVYCTQPVGGFLWAIEYTGTLEDGRRAAEAHGLVGAEYGHWNTMRPIRIIARVTDPARAAKPAELLARTGIGFKPNSFTHTYTPREKYQRLFEAIAWDWKA